jgi:hypothetical protein
MIDRMTRDGQEAPHRPARTVGQCPFGMKKFLFTERAVVHAVQDLASARCCLYYPDPLGWRNRPGPSFRGPRRRERSQRRLVHGDELAWVELLLAAGGEEVVPRPAEVLVVTHLAEVDQLLRHVAGLFGEFAGGAARE